MKLLTTFDEVIDELGGLGEVAHLTGRSKSSVCNWRRKTGRFPTVLFFIMRRALKMRGATAPPALWGFTGELMPADEEGSLAA
jgi:hypothetical protein